MPLPILQDHLWLFFFVYFPHVCPFFSSWAALPAFLSPRLRSEVPPTSRGRDQGPGPRPLPTRHGPPSFPDRVLRARACARIPARGPDRCRERALCGRCRHVVVVVRRRRRRRSTPARRSSGPGAAPRRPWLGASWGGGGGRSVVGLAMSYRPVRSPPPPPLLSPPGRSWRRGRPRPGSGGCHP